MAKTDKNDFGAKLLVQFLTYALENSKLDLGEDAFLGYTLLANRTCVWYNRNTMITEIHEPVNTISVFKKGQIRPVSFLWGSKKYRIKRVLGSYEARKGRSKLYHFTVKTDSDTVFELSFDNESLLWKLERIYDES